MQNINLYDPRLERQRDWLAPHYVAGTALLLSCLVAAAGFAARSNLPALTAQSAAGEAQVKAIRDQVTALGQQASSRKPSAQLEQSLVAQRMLLEMRGEILVTLRQSLGPEAHSFAAYLRGLASQTLPGLWLTNFSVNAANDSMEIRGLMLDPALLPEYIRRLNREEAFRGRSFAALKLGVKKPETTAAPAAAGGKVQPAAVQLPIHHEFVLIPAKEGDKATGGGTSGAAKLTQNDNRAGGAG